MVLVFVLMSYTIPGLKKTLCRTNLPLRPKTIPRYQALRALEQLLSLAAPVAQEVEVISSRLLLCARLGSKILRPQGSHVWVISVPKTSQGSKVS